MKNYFKFLKFASIYKKNIIALLFCILLYTIFNALSIGMIGPLFDYVLAPAPKKVSALNIIEKQDTVISSTISKYKNSLIKTVNEYPKKDLLKIIIGIVLLSVFLKALFHALYAYYSQIITQKLLRDIRNILYEHLQVIPMDYFRQKQTGAIISHLTNDVMLLDNFLSQGLINLILNGLQVLLFSLILFYLNWKLAFFSTFVLGFTIIPIKIISKKLYIISKKYQEKIGEIAGVINESVSGAKVVKAYCKETDEEKKFSVLNDIISKNLIKGSKYNAILIPLVEFMAIIGMVLVLIYGGKEIIKGDLSGGQFVLFLGAFLSLGNPIKKLSEVAEYIQQGTAAIDRIFNVLEIPPSIVRNSSDKFFNDLQDNINFSNICFKYSQDKYTLSNINLKIKKGEVIALVGSSGAGKSTLMDMLPRFLEPESGKIEIDNIDIRSFNIKSLRDKIGIVSQEVILFHDSVKNNISYGKLKADQKEIEEAAKLAHAHDFILKFQDGYENIIGERGSKLSGGQRQRISIARAILKNPPILILDEATSNIDLQSEKLVQDALHNLMKGKTTFIIAHRFSSLKQANRIVVLESGKITAIGTHKELIDSNEYYKHLWQLQHDEKF